MRADLEIMQVCRLDPKDLVGISGLSSPALLVRCPLLAGAQRVSRAERAPHDAEGTHRDHCQDQYCLHAGKRARIVWPRHRVYRPQDPR